MRDINSMSKWEYLYENAFWSVLAIFWYKHLVFTNVFGFDDNASKWVLYISVATFVIIGVLLTINKRRNNMNVFINIALPFVAYTVLAYMKYLGAFIITMFVIATISSIAYVLMTKKYSKTQASRKQKYFNFKRFSFLGVRTIVTSCTTLILVYLIATSVTGLQLFRPGTEEAKNTMPDFVEYYENNADTFDKLEETRWGSLSVNEKLDVLQVVCNAERAKLGIKESIYIKSRAFQSDLLGEYIDKDHTVLINIKHLEEDSSYSIIMTVTHECYHSYERSLVELYDSVSDEQKELMAFARAKYYKKEFADYKDGESEDYYWQAVEIDAREYSEKAADDYKNKILSHLEYSK